MEIKPITKFDYLFAIRSIMKEYNISQYSIAEGTGISVATIHRIFNNKNNHSRDDYNMSVHTWHDIKEFLEKKIGEPIIIGSNYTIEHK